MMLMFALACRPDRSPAGPDVEVTRGPAAGPNPDAPLVVVLAVTTDQPATIEVEVSSDDDEPWVTAPSTVPLRDHALELFGMRPEVPYTLVVHATDATGRVGRSEPLPFTPPPLAWASLQTRVVETGPDADPGLWAVVTWHGAPTSAIQAFDDQGRLRWIFQTHHAWVNDQHFAPDGTVWYEDEDEVVQVRLDGTRVRRYAPAAQAGPEDLPVEVPAFHHSITLLDDGFLALAKDQRLVPDFPTSVLQPEVTAPALVNGDRVVEVGLDGAIRGEWDTHDLLDVHRVRWDSLEVGYGYGIAEDGYDWTHTNGTWYDAGVDAVVFSCRHQDAVFSVGRDGALRWILGTPSGWAAPWSDLLLTPIGADFQWPRHQHAPQVVARDGDVVELMVFDNGNDRPLAGTPDDQDLEGPFDEYTRLVRYRVDERARTVEQVWTWDRGDEDWFSDCCSNAFVSDSGHVFVGDVNGRVMEIDPTEPSRKVLEIAWDPAPGEAAFTRYTERAYRIPDLRTLPPEP